MPNPSLEENFASPGRPVPQTQLQPEFEPPPSPRTQVQTEFEPPSPPPSKPEKSSFVQLMPVAPSKEERDLTLVALAMNDQLIASVEKAKGENGYETTFRRNYWNNEIDSWTKDSQGTIASQTAWCQDGDTMKITSVLPHGLRMVAVAPKSLDVDGNFYFTSVTQSDSGVLHNGVSCVKFDGKKHAYAESKFLDGAVGPLPYISNIDISNCVINGSGDAFQREGSYKNIFFKPLFGRFSGMIKTK